VIAGVNYVERELWNQMQEVEYGAGKLDNEEYHRNLWHEIDLQPEVGCRFTPKLEGPGVHVMDEEVGGPVRRHGEHKHVSGKDNF